MKAFFKFIGWLILIIIFTYIVAVSTLLITNAYLGLTLPEEFNIWQWIFFWPFKCFGIKTL